MKYLSILVLMMSCWASYGGTKLAPHESIRDAELVLEIAENALEKAESNEEKANARIAVRKAKASLKAAKKALAKRAEANRALATVDTEAVGYGKCANCQDDIASSHNTQVDIHDNTVASGLPADESSSRSHKSSSGKTGSR